MTPIDVVERLLVTGNLCHGVQMRGTGAGSSLPAATNTVRGNVIRGNGCAGLHLFQHALENTVEGNSVAGNAGGGVFLESTGPINSPRNNVLRWNVVQGNRGDGVTETGFSNTMVGNVITTNGLDGVHIRATLAAITGSRVEANQIRGNGRNGVLVDPFRLGNQVLGNTALGNAAFDLADENAQCRGAIWAGKHVRHAQPALYRIATRVISRRAARAGSARARRRGRRR